MQNPDPHAARYRTATRNARTFGPRIPVPAIQPASLIAEALKSDQSALGGTRALTRRRGPAAGQAPARAARSLAWRT